MGVKKVKPTSAGRRNASFSDFAGITRDKPEKSLVRPKPATGGRNAHGRITTRHRGGGVKRMYRVIDFRRDKDGIPAKVAQIEYDPNRSARIALLHYVDGEKRYIVAPRGVEVGQTLLSGSTAEIRPGNCLTLSDIPVGTIIHNVELKPSGGAKMARSAGMGVQLVAKEASNATLRLPSGEVRTVNAMCRATVGSVGNAESELIRIGKAGRNRLRGKRPTVRGVAMNPVDHPLGGGEGRSSGGRHPSSPWGKKEGRTRRGQRYSDGAIIRRRGAKRRSK